MCGVRPETLKVLMAEAVLKDGREFSILSCTPHWWKAELEKRGLAYYFGPMVLFMKKIDAPHAKRAVRRMADVDELLFCRYDTPRKTLPEILDAFQAVAVGTGCQCREILGTEAPTAQHTPD